MTNVNMDVVEIEKEENDQIIVGMANFTIKTCDDLFRAVLASVANVRVAVAMNEAAPKLTRVTGNDKRLEDLASRNALKIGASHAFVILMNNAYPINVMDKVRNTPGLCAILGATANPCQVIVARTELGSAILGFVDGNRVESVEDGEGARQRRELVKKIGYPLG